MHNAEAPGSVRGLHLIVPDIEAARAELAGRGMEIGEIFQFEAGQQMPGPDPRTATTTRSSRSATPTAPAGWSKRSADPSPVPSRGPEPGA